MVLLWKTPFGIWGWTLGKKTPKCLITHSLLSQLVLAKVPSTLKYHFLTRSFDKRLLDVWLLEYFLRFFTNQWSPLLITKHSERCASVHFADALLEPILDCIEFTKLDLLCHWYIAGWWFLEGGKVGDLFWVYVSKPHLSLVAHLTRPNRKRFQNPVADGRGLGSRGISSSMLFKSPMSCCYTLPVLLPVCLLFFSFFFGLIGKTDSPLHKARDVLMGS